MRARGGRGYGRCKNGEKERSTGYIIGLKRKCRSRILSRIAGSSPRPFLLPLISFLSFHAFAPSSLPFPPLAEESSARRRWDYHRLDNAPPMETVLRFLSSGRIRFEKIKRGTYLLPFLFVSFSILFRGRRRRKGSGMDERLLRRGIIRSLFLFRFTKMEYSVVGYIRNNGVYRNK